MKTRNISDTEYQMHKLRLDYVNTISKFTAISVSEAFRMADLMITPIEVTTDENQNSPAANPKGEDTPEESEYPIASPIRIGNQPTTSPTQKVTPQFEDMVDPKIKSTVPDKKELQVSEELYDSRTAGGTIPMRYEDRVKYAEGHSSQPQKESIERADGNKVDGRGFGESGGDYPPLR